MYYRHGDVLFERIEVAPSDSRRTQTEDEKTGVVQRGESTGHAHIIDDMAGSIYFQSLGGVSLAQEKSSQSRMRNTNL